MVKKVFSIIIPTVADSRPTLQSLPSEDDLISMGGELIVVRDRWRNASRARNIGAAVARGTVFCFIDDDAAFNFSELYDYIKKIMDNPNVFYWADAPHILIVSSEVFFRAGGYDERHPVRGAEPVEIRERLKSMGYELRMLDISLKHLRDTWDREHALAANKSLTWTYITYHYLPLRKVLWRKHPIELARRWLWALEWVLVRSHMRRSILYR
jgi:glycosyltransferase involved in cell wall biosynthesis